jgi:two-component system cell cycle sensor histidine kinase/response regulator CckA
LTSGGYTVLEARNGVEALEVCQRLGASVDLLVTDVVMPKMTGLELARRLAVDHPELKVLCLSGYSAEATAAQRPLAWPFLAKPFVPAALLERVREVLDIAPENRLTADYLPAAAGENGLGFGTPEIN